jgi:outer membrane lipoprotein SlyB
MTFTAPSATTPRQSKERGGLTFRFLVSALVLACLSGCGPSYSPNTYASDAAQKENKVEQGIVVGVRNVAVSASGAVGTVTGAAAGGIAGSQVGVGPTSAFSALGGSLVGGLAGSAAEHVTSDTTAYEYIVRKTTGDLVSVTQKDKVPLTLGEKVLVIAGNQARVVADYTDPLLSPPAKAAAKAEVAAATAKPAEAKPADGPPAAASPQATQPAQAAAQTTQPSGTVAAPAVAGSVAGALDGTRPATSSTSGTVAPGAVAPASDDAQPAPAVAGSVAGALDRTKPAAQDAKPAGSATP